MSLENTAAVVLAGGKGTRMQSPKPKILHKIGGQPMIFYALNNLYQLGFQDIYVVVGFQANLVKKTIAKNFPVLFALQDKPLGTGHAVKTALEAMQKNYDNLLVVNGDDSAFYSQQTLKDFITSHQKSQAAVSLMTLKLGDRNKLGKVIKTRDGKFLQMLEDKEYLDSGYKTEDVSCGAYMFNIPWLKENVKSLTLNPKGEYYINDLPNLAVQQGKKVKLFRLQNPKEWVGVNNRDELRYANLIMKGKQTA